MSEARSDREWIDFYDDQYWLYDAFVGKLRVLIGDLLDEGDIAYSWVITFTESPYDVSVALVRARRDGHDFANPLESSLRVAGVTIGIANPLYGPPIGDLVRREFVVDPAGSLLPDPPASTDEAYEFPYFLLSLDERRADLDEWARFAGLKVRVEVKTDLQDAWETLVTSLPLEEAGSYPGEVRDILKRSVQAMSALDDDLTELWNELWRLQAEYEEAVAGGNLELPLDAVSLAAYTNRSELLASLTEVAGDVGFHHDADPDDWRTVERDLLWLLRTDGLQTLGEVEDFLKQATPRARETLAELFRISADRGYELWASPHTILEALWLILHRADAETIVLMRYRDEIAYALNTLIGNPVPPDADDE